MDDPNDPKIIENARIMGISLDTEPGPHGGTIEVVATDRDIDPDEITPQARLVGLRGPELDREIESMAREIEVRRESEQNARLYFPLTETQKAHDHEWHGVGPCTCSCGAIKEAHGPIHGEARWPAAVGSPNDFAVFREEAASGVEQALEDEEQLRIGDELHTSPEYDVGELRLAPEGIQIPQAEWDAAVAPRGGIRMVKPPDLTAPAPGPDDPRRPPAWWTDDDAEEARAPGAPIEGKGRQPITRATDGRLIPTDHDQQAPGDRRIRLTVAQRAWAGDRHAETAEQITGGLGVSYVDLDGFDPDGQPVTLRTSAVAYVELFAEGRKSFHGPIVALAMLAPVNLIYVDRDGQPLTAGSLHPAEIGDELTGYAKVGWPTVLEAGQTRELTPEQEAQLREADTPASKVTDLMENLEQSVANAKAGRAHKHGKRCDLADCPKCLADYGPPGSEIDAPESDAAGYVLHEDAGPQGETIVEGPDA